MSINRRNFLSLAALSTATWLTSESTAHEDGVIHTTEPFGVLVDTVVCVGCRKCEWACNQQNALSEEPLKAFEDKSVFKEHRRPTDKAFTVVNQFTNPNEDDKAYTMKVQCMHCLEAACVSACLVGAMEKTPDGPVIYDEWKCIGCRYCMVACPFQVPAYEYSKAIEPKVMKCSLCYERITKEQKPPACVGICPNEALTFGTRKEVLEMAHARIKMYPDKYVNHVYGENEIGGTSWLYLAPADFKNTELPNLPDESIPEKTESIQHGIFKSFVPPIALYGLLGLIMHATGNLKEEQED